MEKWGASQTTGTNTRTFIVCLAYLFWRNKYICHGNVIWIEKFAISRTVLATRLYCIQSSYFRALLSVQRRQQGAKLESCLREREQQWDVREKELYDALAKATTRVSDLQRELDTQHSRCDALGTQVCRIFSQAAAHSTVSSGHPNGFKAGGARECWTRFCKRVRG